MDNEEIKNMLKDVIGNFIKDEQDEARENFHNALTMKAREKLNTTIDKKDDLSIEKEEIEND